MTLKNAALNRPRKGCSLKEAVVDAAGLWLDISVVMSPLSKTDRPLSGVELPHFGVFEATHHAAI